MMPAPNMAPGVQTMDPGQLTALLSDPRTPPGMRAAAMAALQMRQPQGQQPQPPAAPASAPAPSVDIMGAMREGAALADNLRGVGKPQGLGMAAGGPVRGYAPGGAVDDTDDGSDLDTAMLDPDAAGMGGGGLSGMDPRFTAMVKAMMSGAQGAPTREDKGLALAQMGFGIAASPSPHLGQAVGQGALVGLDALQKLRQQRAVQAMRAASLAEQVGYHGDLIKTRKDIADQQKASRDEAQRIAKEKADADKAAKERGDWVPGGVDPDTGNIVLYNKYDPSQTKVISSRPKPTGAGAGGLAAKIAAFEETYDRPTALKLATGEFKAVQDPFTHVTKYIDVSTGAPAVLAPKTTSVAPPVPAPAAAADAPVGGEATVPPPGPVAPPAPAVPNPAAAPPTAAPPDVPLLGDTAFMGPKAYLQARTQKMTLGFTDPGPELNEARAKLGQLRLQAVDAFGGMAHMSKQKIAMLNDVLPEKGFFSSPKLAYDKLSSLATQTQKNVNDDIAIRDDRTASPQARKDAEKRINASTKLLRMIGNPSQFKRPVDTDKSAVSTGDPAGDALVKKYLSQ